MQYYYRIKHKPTNMIYVGSQYGKRADPDLFFVKYFTSSKRVRQLILEEGKGAFEIQKIVVCKDARNYERRVLQYWYRKLGRELFMEQFLNRNTAPGILNDDDTKHKIYSNTERHAKIESKKLGNTNVRGKAWWNDGTSMKRSVSCPGEGWIKGALKHSEETKKKRSDSNKGKTMSDESRLKMSQARTKEGHGGNHKGSMWIVDENGKRRRINNERNDNNQEAQVAA